MSAVLEMKRTDVAVKVDSRVIAKAKAVASLRGVTLAEYLSTRLDPIVTQDLAEEYAKTNEPESKPSRPKR